MFLYFYPLFTDLKKAKNDFPQIRDNAGVQGEKKTVRSILYFEGSFSSY